MNIKEIQNLIKFISKSGVDEVTIEKDDFKITIKSSGEVSKSKLKYEVPVSSPKNESTEFKTDETSVEVNKKFNDVVDDEKKYTVIKSPIIGTFYRRSSPDNPPFVELNSEVKKGETLCVIEAMKLFNEIECEMDCKIIKILVDDQTPIEFDQPLFLVDPS
ncbi:MAG: acetyl-CoA carboxylase, biotin carboxyl carrier protein [Flavobacteriaceae bacterium]|jgi:acetyl-CoA carboxylase biotin carboxyl carrier protein|nr:acetyl-CoA carboxylase, biotin carboxyl carrier protein [Flavobacteriaceae bacterium]|tara:strand:+ start:613 stop:1095 length:483 start_codon:yes stop_codon:yes gene_type:complete